MKTQLNEIKRMQQLAGILNENKSELEEIDFKKAAAIGAMALGTLGNPDPAMAAKHHDKGKHPIHQTVQHKNVVKDALSSGKFSGQKDIYGYNWKWTVTYKNDEKNSLYVSSDITISWDSKNLKTIELTAHGGSMEQIFEDFLKLKHKKHTNTSRGEAIYAWIILPNTMETVNFIGDFLKYAKSQHVRGIVQIK